MFEGGPPSSTGNGQRSGDQVSEVKCTYSTLHVHICTCIYMYMLRLMTTKLWGYIAVRAVLNRLLANVIPHLGGGHLVLNKSFVDGDSRTSCQRNNYMYYKLMGYLL